MLTNTKHPRDTRTLVAKVKEFCDNNPERSRQILDEIHSIGLWCIDAFSQSKELNSQLITNLEVRNKFIFFSKLMFNKRIVLIVIINCCVNWELVISL